MCYKVEFHQSINLPVLGVVRDLNNFATTKINFAALFACEVAFLHMYVNCREEQLTLNRKKVIFMGSILEKKISFAATLDSNF